MINLRSLSMKIMNEQKITFKTLNAHSGQDGFHTNDKIAEFLEKHLEQYGDPKEDIMKCLDYVCNGTGGNVVLAVKGDDIMGAVITNKTGMSGYIPENILVYIAVSAKARGEGLGGKLIENVLKITEGDMALHVEPDNPAKRLYERVGFENKYLEMRYKRK